MTDNSRKARSPHIHRHYSIGRQTELVFVNYGHYEDFETVEASGIKKQGRLVVAKAGHGFRGDKVQNAQRFNASGLLLYP